ncbi:MAG: hypothetical protein AAB214_10720 [Fibrobacterota bacterium]
MLVTLIPFSGCREKEGPTPIQTPKQVSVGPALAQTTADPSPDSQQPRTCNLPQAIDRYNEMMAAWKSGPHPSSMAELWKLADSASEALMDSLDCLTESDYHLAESSFKGFIVSREEQYLSDPDYEFFQSLADSFGLANDKAFFQFAKKNMYRKHSWEWEEQFSDAGWCVRLSSPEIVEGYLAAEILMTAEASEYRWWIEPRLRWIDSSLHRSNCVCDSQREAITGLNRSILRVPQSHPLRKSLEATLVSMRNKNDDVRFSCHTE